MQVFGQIARLFNLAALRLFALLLIGILFSSALYAQSEGLSATASIKIEPAIIDGKPALVGSYQITCNIQDDKTTYGFGEMKLFYSITVGDGDEEVRGLSGLYADGGSSKPSGAIKVTGPLGGARVRARLSGAYCHHEQLNSELLTVWSEDVIIPPQISVVAAFNPDSPNAAPYVSMLNPPKITDAVNVPVGKRLVVMLDINAHPQKTESLVLYYRNAGVDYTHVLYYDLAQKYNPMEQIVTPTIAGDANLKIWAEFRPTQTKSNVLSFHILADPDKPKEADSSEKPKPPVNPEKPPTKKPLPPRKTKH